MPIYEYRCTACGHEFSKFESLGAAPRGLECPACHEPKAERKLSTFASASGSSTPTSCPAPGGGCGSGFS